MDLMAAVKGGDGVAVRRILGDGNGSTALHHAADRANADIVQLLLQAGFSPHALDTEGKTPLHCGINSLEVVRLLLNAGAQVDAKALGNTPLCWAASRDVCDVCALLVESGADVGARNINGVTALHQAARHASVATCRQLLTDGADVNATDNDGETPLSWVTTVGNVRVLIEAGANPSGTNERDWPLYQAVLEDNVAVVQALLAAGANVHRSSRTVLCEATSTGAVTALLEAGIVIDESDVAAAPFRHIAKLLAAGWRWQMRRAWVWAVVG